ncbi:hypothetical protein V1605_19990 [Enterobacter soli]|uniref:hypothetical protein n=1 Tax=Enterobacter soli TaxID=885040 RepID=UPI001C27CB0B|nr:hypothetical protein [Enterobacter soli]
MIKFQLYQFGMSHVVHVNAWFENGVYYAESAFWINNGKLVADSIEELATSIAGVVKSVSAQDILSELQNIHNAAG